MIFAYDALMGILVLVGRKVWVMTAEFGEVPDGGSGNNRVADIVCRDGMRWTAVMTKPRCEKAFVRYCNRHQGMLETMKVPLLRIVEAARDGVCSDRECVPI